MKHHIEPSFRVDIPGHHDECMKQCGCILPFRNGMFIRLGSCTFYSDAVRMDVTLCDESRQFVTVVRRDPPHDAKTFSPYLTSEEGELNGLIVERVEAWIDETAAQADAALDSGKIDVETILSARPYVLFARAMRAARPLVKL